MSLDEDDFPALYRIANELARLNKLLPTLLHKRNSPLHRRERIATAAMAGLMSTCAPGTDLNLRDCAEAAVNAADLLAAELDK